MKGENMAKRPTDEETWALQKMWAENPPELLEGSGPLTRRHELLSLLDDVSANYILTIAERDHKTPSQLEKIFICEAE
jgi:hypothetical protein